LCAHLSSSGQEFGRMNGVYPPCLTKAVPEEEKRRVLSRLPAHSLTAAEEEKERRTDDDSTLI